MIFHVVVKNCVLIFLLIYFSKHAKLSGNLVAIQTYNVAMMLFITVGNKKWYSQWHPLLAH